MPRRKQVASFAVREGFVSIRNSRPLFHASCALLLVTFSAVLASCGGNSSMIPTGPIGGEKTNVVVLLTNTANDQLVKFYVTLDTLTLTDKFGNEVTLYDSGIPSGQGGAAPGEFVHL